MEVAAGAMTPLLRKLGELLLDEYNLEKRVRKGVESLVTELEMMHAVIRKVSEKPPDQLDEQVRIWAGKVRELSYNMEDAVDTFMVRVEDDHDRGPTNVKNRVKKFLRKTTKLFSNGKALHQVSNAIEEAQGLAKVLGELRQRYMLEAHANSTGDIIDPRLKAVYRDVSELVGIDHTRDELIKELFDGDEGSDQQLKTISIVGLGGLGKTTLAKAVYDKIKAQFDCGAFVSVSQNPDMKKVFKDMLYELDKGKFKNIHNAGRDEKLLIDELREFLKDKRYLIVIDDIWDKNVWESIECAFSKSSLGSQIMTTTRIGSVSEACCSSGDHIIYRMKPLSDDDSKSLFYKRIFPQGSECPHELKQVSRDILKKCGGVPLAIITIASLLADNGQRIKPKYQWDNLVNSIGRGLTEDASLEEMQRILSFSYYDLPSHLKTCLLYLCIFPEDYKIRRDRLIWRWIAEGFIQARKQETKSLFEIGESYFNDLINRNMIQPININAQGRAKACRVHDMVLDLICSLSSEQNFVTILDGTEWSTPNSQRKIRRLSFQNGMSEITTPQLATISMSQVRSVTLFSTVVQIESLSRFQVLRVLDLEGCHLRESGHNINLRWVENLLHLRYLGLKGTYTCELSIEIGKLRFLETLDLSRTGCGSEVPSSIVGLRHLMCLCVDDHMKMPVGMGNLASLEELSVLRVDGSHEIAKELGQLTELRVLELLLDGCDESVCNSLVVSLGNLHKLQSLMIHFDRGFDNPYAIYERFNVNQDGWVPPPHLRTLLLRRCTSTLPRWINSTSPLPLLSFLHMVVHVVRGEDIQILGKLPALRSLFLETIKDQYIRSKRFTVGADAFPRVTECTFRRFTTMPSMFPRGAMPRLEFLRFWARALDIANGGLGMGMGMGHLPSLRRIEASLFPEEAKEDCLLVMKEADDALRLSADAHPNRPTLDIYHSTFPIKYDDESEEEGHAGLRTRSNSKGELAVF